MHQLLTSILVAALIILSYLAPVAATTFTVNSLLDDGDDSCTPSYCTLRDAIRNATSGDVISFADGLTGNIVISKGQITVDESIEIIGPGAEQISLEFISDGGYSENSKLTLYNGRLYGMTTNGGNTDSGTIFSYDLDTGAYQKLHDFSYSQASRPYGALTLYDGVFYGTTYGGGADQYGTIFSFNPATNEFQVVYEFGQTGGRYPRGSLLVYNDLLYGLTSSGSAGGWGYGTLFSFDPSNNTHQLHFSFGDPNGRTPYGALVEYNGQLYGMTYGGGANSSGTIFSFNPSNNTFTKRHDLAYANGSSPQGDLTVVGDMIYGMTLSGGSQHYGVIFSFNPADNAYQKIHDFASATGSYPRGSLELYDGKLYGMTRSGGSNGGGCFSPMI